MVSLDDILLPIGYNRLQCFNNWVVCGVHLNAVLHGGLSVGLVLFIRMVGLCHLSCI